MLLLLYGRMFDLYQNGIYAILSEGKIMIIRVDATKLSEQRAGQEITRHFRNTRATYVSRSLQISVSTTQMFLFFVTRHPTTFSMNELRRRLLTNIPRKYKGKHGEPQNNKVVELTGDVLVKS